MQVNGKQIVAYAALPQIIPRARELFASGFQFVPYFMALIYASVRLLPRSHPYLQYHNIGQFGMQHVIAQAANNMKWTRHNIDQIIVFIAILVGLVLIFVQIAALSSLLFLQPVMAQMPTNFSEFFITQNPEQDLAGMMMDMTFGIPDMFNSCVSQQGVPCEYPDGSPITNEEGQWVLEKLGFPFPIHFGMFALFRVYNIAILVIAVLVSFYFITAVVMETAQTGTPFGKRYNKVWAPIRFLVAFGLLVPIGPGLNGAQYSVLYAAKFGTGFANNGWRIFNETINNETITGKQKLISEPELPEVSALLQFMFVAHTCYQLHQLKPKNAEKPIPVKAYLIRDPLSAPSFKELPISYDEMLKFNKRSKRVVIRFGQQDKEAFPRYKGNVKPTCGEVVLTLTDTTGSENGQQSGQEIMQRGYYFWLWFLWNLGPAAIGTGPYYYASTSQFAKGSGGLLGLLGGTPPTAEDRSRLNNWYQDRFKQTIEQAITEQEKEAEKAMEGPLLEKGWAGAAIWYNRIAELNGALTTAVFNVPSPAKYPEIMEWTAHKKSQQDSNLTPSERFDPKLAGNDTVSFEDDRYPDFAKVLSEAFDFWQEDGGSLPTSVSKTGNAFVDAINALFGTQGLYDMKENNDVHPLAQLVGIGKSLVESSIRAFGYSVIGAGVGFAIPALGGLSSTLISFLMTVASVTMTIGFVLFYVIPFMPFIFFFFAVGGWIKGIFEAMVGAPLWALAHINIEGEGLPGKSASSGYYLILEVFLRPILILFGLLASITIFSAMVNALNETWELVVANLSGFNVEDAEDDSIGSLMRGPVDEFFFTVIYAIMVYLMGNSSFKLIDLIPKSILRWMGSSVTAFNDEGGNDAENLQGKAAIIGQQVSGPIAGKGGQGGVSGGLSAIATRGASIKG